MGGRIPNRSKEMIHVEFGPKAYQDNLFLPPYEIQPQVEVRASPTFEVEESGTGDTNITSKVLEDGAETSQKESLNELAARQQKFINNLNNALIRIKNGTYGICKVTGKLIPKERLRAVPHTMLSIEAKLEEKK